MNGAVQATPSGTDRIATRFLPCASIPGTPWHVAYTKPLREASVVKKLREEGAAVWRPIKLFRAPNGQERYEPLFPRYVLMQMTGERLKWGYTIRNQFGYELGHVLRSPAGTPMVIPDAEMEWLTLQSEDDGIIREPARPQVALDDRGRVLTGWAAQLQGICTRTSRDRVWLLLSVLGRETPVEFRRGEVELVA
jgi:transcription antitermination factor NusG